MSHVVAQQLPGTVLNSSMRRVASNVSRPAFGQVYREHKHKLYSYIFFRVNQNRDVAEDIVSDVFVKAYEKFDSYNSQYAMSTWLYAIARNTLIDHYRRQREVVDIDELPIAAEDDPLYVLIQHNISLTEVEEALTKLPDTQQHCIREQFFNGKSGAMIAAETGHSHDAVRKHVSRGIAALRAALLSVPLSLVIPFI